MLCLNPRLFRIHKNHKHRQEVFNSLFTKGVYKILKDRTKHKDRPGNTLTPHSWQSSSLAGCHHGPRAVVFVVSSMAHRLGSSRERERRSWINNIITRQCSSTSLTQDCPNTVSINWLYICQCVSLSLFSPCFHYTRLLLSLASLGPEHQGTHWSAKCSI